MQTSLRTSVSERKILQKALIKLEKETGRKATLSKTIRHAVKEYAEKQSSIEQSKN